MHHVPRIRQVDVRDVGNACKAFAFVRHAPPTDASAHEQRGHRDASQKALECVGAERRWRCGAVQRVVRPPQLSRIIHACEQTRSAFDHAVWDRRMHSRKALDGFFDRCKRALLTLDLLHVAQPRTHACNAGRRRIGMKGAESFEKRESLDAIGHRSRAKRCNRSAHRVADERDAFSFESIEESGDIADVIGKVVIAACPDVIAVAEASQIRRKDFVTGACKRFGNQFPRGPRIEKSVEQKHGQTRRLCVFRLETMNVEPDFVCQNVLGAALHDSGDLPGL